MDYRSIPDVGAHAISDGPPPIADMINESVSANQAALK